MVSSKNVSPLSALNRNPKSDSVRGKKRNVNYLMNLWSNFFLWLLLGNVAGTLQIKPNPHNLNCTWFVIVTL